MARKLTPAEKAQRAEQRKVISDLKRIANAAKSKLDKVLATKPPPKRKNESPEIIAQRETYKAIVGTIRGEWRDYTRELRQAEKKLASIIKSQDATYQREQNRIKREQQKQAEQAKKLAKKQAKLERRAKIAQKDAERKAKQEVERVARRERENKKSQTSKNPVTGKSKSTPKPKKRPTHTLVEARALTPEQLGQFNTSQHDLLELAAYRDALLTNAKRRNREIEKAGLHSFAYQMLEKSKLNEGTSYNIATKGDANKAKNKLTLDIFKLQKFFNDKTSTVKGTRDVNREQDARISKLLGHNIIMTEDERRKYWEIYMEFMAGNFVNNTMYDSNRIQMMLANVFFDKLNADVSLTDMDTMDLLSTLDESLGRLREDEASTIRPAVFHGRGRFNR